MYSIKGTTIYLTRGDTMKITIHIYKDGAEYTPKTGDVIRFAMKKSYDASEVLLQKTIPNDTLLLTLLPTNTKSLDFGTYVYDIQLTNASGEVDTFIKGNINLTEEVD